MACTSSLLPSTSFHQYSHTARVSTCSHEERWKRKIASGRVHGACSPHVGWAGRGSERSSTDPRKPLPFGAASQSPPPSSFSGSGLRHSRRAPNRQTQKPVALQQLQQFQQLQESQEAELAAALPAPAPHAPHAPPRPAPGPHAPALEEVADESRDDSVAEAGRYASNYEAWYMDSDMEDPHLPHQDNGKGRVPYRVLRALGVEMFARMPRPVTEATPEALAQMLKFLDYSHSRYVELCSSLGAFIPGNSPVRTHFREHLFACDTAVYISEGSMYLDIRDCRDEMLRIHLVAGDLVRLPAGVPLRWSLDTEFAVKALLLSKGDMEDMWRNVGFRPDPARLQYIEAALARSTSFAS